MTTKITTLQGASLFATLDLPEAGASDALTSNDLKNVRTSLSENDIAKREQAEKTALQALGKGKFWLAIIVGIASIYALTSAQEETE